MNGKIEAYIDSFKEITILLAKSEYNDHKSFKIVDRKNNVFNLELINSWEEYDFYKFIAKSPALVLNKEYFVVDELENVGLLRSGAIVRDPLFDEYFSYDGPLGMEYSKERTIFRIWSPVAKGIYLEVTKDGETNRFDLVYSKRGLWSVELFGDYECAKYIVYVKVFEDYRMIKDPYALSSTANGQYNYIVDPNKFYKMKYPKPEFSGTYTDAIIYEASIRDFTYYLNNDSKGTFLGMLENRPTQFGPTGIEYIKSLGITHIQLLPCFDFAEVDDLNKDKKYNWGYNPEQYFVPSGWYSKDPNDPYSRINELLELIDNCHKNGIRVIFDVVFNHVYRHEEFPFDYLNPGYNYRVDEYGNMSNASYCGNDFATERYMCSRFIRDVLNYYAKVFGVSGFRFDLMGLVDTDTLNKAYDSLKQIDPDIMVYGEGWNMGSPLPNEKRSHMYNYQKIPNYAFFNDRFRDFVRGNQFDKVPGYCFGNYSEEYFDLYHLVLGSCYDYYKFSNPCQSINYIECHDNYTLYDFAKIYLGGDLYEVEDGARLGISLVLISLGIPFIHAGQEFLRTKQGVENSYNTKDSINRIDYERRDRYISNVNTVKNLISIRKEYSTFRLSKLEDIKKKIVPLSGLTNIGLAGCLLKDEKGELVVIVKNDREVRKVELDSFTMIFDGFRKCNRNEIAYFIKEPGVYIFKGENGKWN